MSARPVVFANVITLAPAAAVLAMKLKYRSVRSVFAP
jgi:hypothetical protein